MQINGVNSFSNAQAFRGAEGEGKKVNKKAVIAAGVGAAAVIGATVAAGLRGKKIAGEQASEEAGKGIAKVVKYIQDGAVDIYNKVKNRISETFNSIKNHFGKAAENVEQTANGDLAEGAAKVNE